MKSDFQNSLVEDYNKHQLEINEYRKKEENMKNIIAKKDEELKGKIVELEKITAQLHTRGVEKLKEFEIGKGQRGHLISGEIYDMSVHQQALIRYESSLQNKEKALDVDFNAIQAHTQVKNGLQSYRAFLRIQEKSLMDASAEMNARAELSTSSTIKETMENKLPERDDEIKELILKILEDRESQHLGGKYEREDLKSQIATPQKNNILQ